MNEWKRPSQWRKCPITISGETYSIKYARSRGFTKEKESEYAKGCAYTFIPEMVEATLDDDNNVLCRLVNDDVYTKRKSEFFTSKGTFVSHNNGEFGGKLIFPNGQIIYGNFVEVFELGKSIYAISSLVHLIIAYVKIYKFSMNLKPKKTKLLYESKDVFWADKQDYEAINFKALYIKDEIAYVLASGYIANKALNSYTNITHLFKITEHKIEKLSFDYSLSYVNNMIISNNKMILGMDKVVAIVDLETKESIAYTPITKNAEMDLINSYTRRARI